MAVGPAIIAWMSDDIPRYELDVLHWHRDKVQKESDNADRRDAQLWLAMAGFLVRNENCAFSITQKGVKYQRETK